MQCIHEPNDEGEDKISSKKKDLLWILIQPLEDEHNVKSCKKRLSCTNDKEKHPTPLHGYIPKNKKVTGDGNQSQNDQEEVKKVALLATSNVPAHWESQNRKYLSCSSEDKI